MAAAESSCSRCGAPAPQGKAALLLFGKAEDAWNSGDLRGGVLLLERALQGGLPPEKLPLAWRRLGVWLEKESQEEGRAELLARAGQAFKKALELNDADDVAHQLFIANLGRQGLLSQAREFYQKRLGSDAGDAVASKQLNVIKLSADFLAQRPPTAAPREPLNAVERWLKPRPWKVGMAGLTCLSSLAMAVVAALHVKPLGQAVPDLGSLSLNGGMPDLDTFLFDPNVWVLQAAMSALALYLMYRNR